MIKNDRGVLLYGDNEPKITGYLIIGKDHYELIGHKVSDIRTNLTIRKIIDEDAEQTDMFDDRSEQSGDRKRDIP